MAFTVSPNMSLIIPGVGTEAGPTYASDVNSSLTLIDQHDHSVGQGVQITPAGLNINTDLTINNNNLTDVRTIRFQAQPSDPSDPTDLGVLYEVGVDLYYRDGAGNAIRITQSGSVAGSTGTITGLPSGTASAAYSSGTFIFQAATLTAADIDGASHIFRNSTPSSFGLTLQPPNAMAADYDLTLPALPASKKILTLDTAGNIVADYDTDNSSLEVSSNTLQVKDQGITQPKLASRGINSSTVGEVAISASCGAFSTSSTSFVNVPNLLVSVNVSSSGRPICLMLIPDLNSGNSGYLQPVSDTTEIRIIDSGITVAYGTWSFGKNSAIAGFILMPSSLQVFDVNPTPSATNTYIVQMRAPTGGTGAIFNARLMAYEI